MRLENGDSYERKHASWIRENLPHYEVVWSAFIGNDGHGRPCPMPGLIKEQASNRQRFSQAHYSFVAKLMSVRNGAKRIAEDLGQATDTTMENVTERLFNLMAATGYIRDMFQEMDHAFKANGKLCKGLNRFYKQRSHVIHGPRLPYRCDEDGLVKIPMVGGENPSVTEWTCRSQWDQIPEKDFDYVANFVKEFDRELLKAVNTHHGKVFDAADRYFNKARITSDCSAGLTNWDASAATETPTIRSSGTCSPEDSEFHQ